MGRQKDVQQMKIKLKKKKNYNSTKYSGREHISNTQKKEIKNITKIKLQLTTEKKRDELL